MERAEDEQDPALEEGKPPKHAVDQNELQALGQLLAGFVGKPTAAGSDSGKRASSKPPARHQDSVSEDSVSEDSVGEDSVSEDSSRDAPSDSRCVELIPSEFGSPPRDLKKRLAELIERLRAFPAGLLYPLREVRSAANGDLQLISAAPSGESLARFVQRNAALRPAHALEIARQILVILAEGQRRKLFHGALDADKVILENRAPRSSSNPHGVCVRLVDFGLVDLISPEPDQARRKREDLDQVGKILAALITGQPMTADSAVLRAALPTELTQAARRLIQRGLGLPKSKRFEQAESMRIAIESLSEWRGVEIQRPSPIGWWIAAASSLALVVVLFLWLRNPAVSAQPEDALTTTLGARELAPGVPLPQAEGVSQQAYRESLDRLEQAQEQLDLLTQRLGQLERDNSKLSIDTEALRAERNALRARMAKANGTASRQPAPGVDQNNDVLAGPERQTEGQEGFHSASESASDRTGDNVTLLGAALEAPLALDAKAVETLAATVTAEDLARALDRFRNSAVPLLIEAEGQTLNRERLGAIPALAAWSRVATQHHLGSQLASLEIARHYFDRMQPLGIPTQEDLDLVRGERAPTELEPWRAHLLFRLALENQPGGLLGLPGTEALWLSQKKDGSLALSVRTIAVQDVNDDATLRAWTVQSTPLAEAGRANVTSYSHLIQRGRSLFELEGDQQTLLADLAAPALKFDPLPRIADKEAIFDLLPLGFEIDGSPLARIDIEQFLKDQAGQAALVQETAQRSSWFLSTWGLARIVDADGTVHQLVFAASP